jgi:hypothetical protein
MDTFRLKVGDRYFEGKHVTPAYAEGIVRSAIRDAGIEPPKFTWKDLEVKTFLGWKPVKETVKRVKML